MARQGLEHKKVRAHTLSWHSDPYFAAEIFTQFRFQTNEVFRSIICMLLVLIPVRGWVNPRAQCGQKDYENWKNPFTSSGLEPATSGL
jgi:hypothetical protein